MPLRRDLLACLCFALLVVAIVVERQARSGDISTRSLLDVRRPYSLVGVQSGKCVAAAASPTGGARLQISTCTGTPDQQFALDPRSGRTYRLRNLGTGMCVDVESVSTENGAAVIQFSCNEGRNQRWGFTRVAPHVYELSAAHSNKQLDVRGAAVEDGTQLDQWDENYGANQRFRLVSAAP